LTPVTVGFKLASKRQQKTDLVNRLFEEKLN